MTIATESTRPSFSAVVLAGGESNRMGADKADLRVEGERLVERQIRVLLEAGASEVLLSVRHAHAYPDLGLPRVMDHPDGKGPLSGIAASLEAAGNPLLFVLGVDMPRVQPSWVRCLLGHCTGPDCGAIARHPGGLEPLAAFYPKAVTSLFVNQLRAGRFAVRVAAGLAVEKKRLTVCALGADEAKWFENWNRPDDITTCY